MEAVSDGCPTGILIDIELQTKRLNNINENKKNSASAKNKGENIVSDQKLSHTWTSGCFFDQSPPNPPSILKTNVFCTPKTYWKTPSPKSMKIISRDASHIVRQLYSSPMNCTEVMICDEVFPDVKSLDDCFDDGSNMKSKSLSPMNMPVSHEEICQNDPNSIDLKKCTVSVSSCTSENVSDKSPSKIVLHSDMRATEEGDSITQGIAVPECSNLSSDQHLAPKPEVTTPKKLAVAPQDPESVEQSVEENKENELEIKQTQKFCNSIENRMATINTKKNQILKDESCVEQCMQKCSIGRYSVFEKKKVKENQNADHLPNSSDQHLAPKPEVTTLKKLAVAPQGPETVEQSIEENIENELEIKQTQKSCNSIENKTANINTKKNQILKDESSVEQCIQKCAIGRYSVLEKKKVKENQNADHIPKSVIGKPKALPQKSNIGRSQSLFCRKDPLYKTCTLPATPKVETSVRRIRSFNDGSAKKTITTVEKKLIPTTDSFCRVLKPKMSTNQVSNIGTGFSTPLQFRRCSQNFKLAAPSSANPVRRKSLAFNSNNSLVASGVKVAALKDQHSIVEKPSVSSSSKLGFGKKLSIQASQLKLKRDSLSRKLFQ